MLTIVRWILVLPVAMAAFVAVAFVLALGAYLPLPGDPPKWIQPALFQMLVSIVAPYVFVLAGAKTAPERRFAAGTALAAGYSIYAGYVMASGLAAGKYQETRTWTIALFLLGVLAAAAACVQLWRDRGSKNEERAAFQDA
jgi:hypothetical protein